MPLLRRLLLSVLAFALAHSALAGSIKEREKDVKERSEPAKEDSKSNDKHGYYGGPNSSFGSGTYPSSSSGSGGFLSDFWSWVILAPFAYRVDDPSSSMDPNEEGWAGESHSIFPRHETGQATVPYFRADYNYQFADWDPQDFRIEAGYKAAAFWGRFTRYTDSSGTKLDLCQYYGGVRYGGYRPDFFPGTFEFGIGIGVVQHTNDVENDYSGGLTILLKYYPVDWFGLEFRPAWYKWQDISIGDYDFSASLGSRYFQLRGGYRWIWDDGMVDEQSGPYAGVSVSF